MNVTTSINTALLVIQPHLTEEETQCAQAIQDLLRKTPRNEYGFPIGIYRPDLLPFHDYLPETAAVDALLGLNTSNSHELTEAGSTPRGYEVGGSPFTHPHPQLTTNVGGAPHAYDEEAEEDETSPEDGDGDGELNDDALSELYPSNAHLNGTQNLPARFGDPVGSLDTRTDTRIAGFRKQDLRASFVPLAYDDGYPTLPDGRPMWSKLACESNEEYLTFQAFLELPMVNDGSRILADLSQTLEASELLHVNGFAHEDFTAKFNCWQKIHYWPIRARAYDLYKMAARRKSQELRALQLQEDHYTKSTGLLDRLMDYMNDKDLFWDQITPKVAIDALKTLVGIQRVSIGLPATTPPVAKGDLQGQSFEMVLRTLAQTGQQATIEETEQRRADDDSALVKRILRDPATTRVAQELIIRMSTGQQLPNNQP